VKYHLRFRNLNALNNSLHPLIGSHNIDWDTSILFPIIPSIGPRNPLEADGGYPGYIREGFLAVQHSLDKAIMIYHNGRAAERMFDNVIILAQRFPYPAHYQDKYLMLFLVIFPWLAVFIFSLSELPLIRNITSEKQKKLKDYQLITGLTNFMIWAAYFIAGLLMFIIIVCAICMTLCLKIVRDRILQYSDPILIVIFFLSFVIASILFGFMISTFFNRAAFAVAAGSFLYFLKFPVTFTSKNSASLSVKLFSCLSLNTALTMGIETLVKMEMKRDGVQWNNAFSPVNQDDNITFAHITGMLLIDAILYGLLAWYVDAVFPGKYGVPKPWYFFLQSVDWFHSRSLLSTQSQVKSLLLSPCMDAKKLSLVHYLAVRQHLYYEFTLHNTKIIAADLSLNLYEGQITVLLGPNGAGKTTTLSILTSLLPFTRGKVCINGYDISTNTIQARKIMGFCPQDNLLFKKLTPSEHLYFYSVVKGVPPEKRSIEIKKVLTDFGLLHVCNVLSMNLSGGTKRKLSLSIALLGDSKVVILDEPTAGMDPVSRRATWDILQQYKESRTILLTTQQMDEADILGDRIAIMVKGTLRCCGSPVFLKRKYGVGYHVIMVKKPDCDIENIVQLINQHIPTASLESNVASELSFILPKEYTQRFEALFIELEKRQKELDIAGFGVSITTMEEVFLKVSYLSEFKEDKQSLLKSPSLMDQNTGEDKNRDMNVPGGERIYHHTLNEDSNVMLNTGCTLYIQQFYAMLVKKAIFTRRNWFVVLIQVLGLLGMSYITIGNFNLDMNIFKRKYNDEPARKMDLEQYGQTIVPVSISGHSDLTQNFTKHLKIMLKAKKQKLQEVQGDLQKYLVESQECFYSCIIALSIEVTRNKKKFTFWFNNEAYHSPSLSLAVLDNIIFMSLSGPDASITVSNKPQPQFTTLVKDKEKKMKGISISFNLLTGISILVSGFCFLTVTERVNNVKHMQFLRGIYVLNFWLSTLLWDLFIYFIACCLLLVVFIFIGLHILIEDYHFLDTLFIFLLFGWSNIPIVYLISFLFSSSTTAFVKIFLINQFLGILTLLPYSMLLKNGVILYSTKKSIMNALLPFPIFNFGVSISKYYNFQEEKISCFSSKNVSNSTRPKSLCLSSVIKLNTYSLEESAIGQNVIAMAALGLIFMFLIYLLETTLWRVKTFVLRYIFFGIYKRFYKDKVSLELPEVSKDEDVQNERGRVLEQRQELLNSPVFIDELTKIYFTFPPIVAIRNISLAIQKEDCFGLLGLNGAGKTTTFKILTGVETPTSGDLFMEGLSITKNILKVRSKIGYCPQYDALLHHMTARETMIMYARLRGISETKINLYVNNFLKMVNLEFHADKVINTYSTGTKRKLSAAIALIGNSPIVLLDEPSTGMDPIARRLLWNTVIQARESGKIIIITSQSMEECDVLCTRLAIMVQGKFVCLGSPQYLKNKFGNIYSLKVKFNTDTIENIIEDFKTFIVHVFPGSVLKHKNQRILNYYIPRKDNGWGKVFGILEKAKNQFGIEDYSFSQITLEQVFLSFANQDKTARDYER
uniref:ABC transporter domain-containing protein n=1 Tax=Otolemur garnettii TaxID=30611 RepID=H0XNJ0_OTOGA